MLCSEWSLVKSDGTTATVQPLRCRCWSCEECSPIRKRQLMAQAHAGHPDTFLTLTVNPARGLDPSERARTLAHAWRSLRKRAMRKYKLAALPFLAVFERTKKGEPHLHILLRVKWLDQKWLSAQMRELIDAPIVDIRRVNGSSKISAYIAKYIGKDPQRFKGTKRYWASRDYEPPGQEPDDEDEEDSTWTEVARLSAGTQVSVMVRQGFTIIEREGSVTTLRCPQLTAAQEARASAPLPFYAIPAPAWDWGLSDD